MMRRRAWTYLLAYICGIISGFFVLERGSVAAGSMILVFGGICAMLAELGTADDRRSRRMLVIILAAGFLGFALRYLGYELPDKWIAATDTGKSVNINSSISEEMAEGKEYDADRLLLERADEIIGRICSVSVSEGKIQMIIRDVRAGARGQWDEGHYDLGKVQATYYADDLPDDPETMVGERIKMHGSVSEAETRDNPGCFDYRLFLRGRGIRYVVTCKSYYLIYDGSDPGDISYLSDNSGRGSGISDRLADLYWRHRQHVAVTRERFLGLFDDDISGFIRGMIFGDKSGIDEEMREEFNINGTGHILAVSGLHIGFLYALLRTLSGRRKSRSATAAVIAVLVLYSEMTMLSASTIRAVIVLTVSLLAVHLRGRADLLTSVSISALILLTANPYQLFDTGFQMSYMALVSIAFMAAPLSKLTGEGPGVMLAVQLGIAPMTAYIFHRFNILSIFINIPVIALASLMVPACILLLMIMLITGSVPGIAVTMAEGLADIIVKLNSILAADGRFSSLTVSVNVGIAVFFYLAILLVSSEWMRIMIIRKDYMQLVKPAAGILIMAILIGTAGYNTFADDEVVFVSVGQGDCTHIRSARQDILIDGGGSANYNVGTKILMPYLLANGAPDVDLALVTHLHTDHYLGIYQLAGEYPVGSVGIPADYRESIERLQSQNKRAKDNAPYNGADSGSESGDDRKSDSEGNRSELPENITYIESGTTIRISDDVFIEPIWPVTKKSISTDDPNENNMVYMINYRDIRIMVTGDLLESDELDMLQYYRGTDKLRCDILKVAHHGSHTSSCEAFLDAASPKIAVIQAGRNNMYGHPHQETLDKLGERGIEVFRTDLDGAVGIDIGRHGITVDTIKQGRNTGN